MRYLFHTSAAGLSELALAEIRQQGLIPVEVTAIPDQLPIVRPPKTGFPRHGPRRSPVDDEDIRRLAAEGKSQAEIARALDCNPTTVKNHALKAGIEIPVARRGPARRNNPTQRHYDTQARELRKAEVERKLEYIKKRHAENATLAQVGHELGLTRERIRQIAAKHGIRFSPEARSFAARIARRCAVCDDPIPLDRTSKTCGEKCKRALSRKTHLRMIGERAPETLSDEMQAEILRLRRLGHSTAHIAASLDSSIPSVTTVLAANGMSWALGPWGTPLRQQQLRALKERREKALEMYDGGMSEDEIASALDISAMSARNDIRRARAERAAQAKGIDCAPVPCDAGVERGAE